MIACINWFCTRRNTASHCSESRTGVRHVFFLRLNMGLGSVYDSSMYNCVHLSRTDRVHTQCGRSLVPLCAKQSHSKNLPVPKMRDIETQQWTCTHKQQTRKGTRTGEKRQANNGNQRNTSYNCEPAHQGAEHSPVPCAM